MHKLILIFLFEIIFISCQEQSKTAKKEEVREVVTDVKDNLQLTTNYVRKDTIKKDQLVFLPFDFEKYTAICLQQDSFDCQKKYPKLNDIDFRKVTFLLGDKSEDIPTNIFQIHPTFSGDTEIYLLDFEGDSSYQEIITVNNQKIISRISVGYSMPEEKTYKSFSIESDMTIKVYEIDYESLKKSIKEKYIISPNGKY